jgi:hypothetical protein
VAAVAIASAALICGLSAAVMRREWGGAARWPAVALVPVTTLMLMSSGAFPFAAGLAAACVAIERAGAGRRGTAAVAAAASVAFSPLAGLLLATLLAAALFGRPGVRRRLVRQRRLAAGIALALVAGAVLQRAFPSGGRYPFAGADVVVVLGFCLLGLWLCRGAARARPLAALFAAYLAINLAAFAAPGPLGSNTTRLFATAGGPLILLAAIIGRPHRRLLVVPLVVAVCRPARPGPSRRLVEQRRSGGRPGLLGAGRAGPDRALGRPAPGRGGGHGRRLGVVLPGRAAGAADSGLVPAGRLPPERRLYAERLSAGAYRRWLHRLGVEYVLLPAARLDYSSQAEARLLRSGTSGLRLAARLPGWTVYRLRQATPLVTRRGRRPGDRDHARRQPDHLLGRRSRQLRRPRPLQPLLGGVARSLRASRAGRHDPGRGGWAGPRPAGHRPLAVGHRRPDGGGGIAGGRLRARLTGRTERE